MDMNRKMISDLIMIIGIVFAVIGWSGRASGGWGSVVSYGMIGIGIALLLWGLARYAGGFNRPEE